MYLNNRLLNYFKIKITNQGFHVLCRVNNDSNLIYSTDNNSIVSISRQLIGTYRLYKENGMDNRRIDRIKVSLNYFLKNKGLASFEELGKNDIRFKYRETPSDELLTFRAYIIDTLNDEACYTKAFVLECENIKVPLVYQDLVNDEEFESVGLDKIIEDYKSANAVKEQIEKELDDVF